MNRARVRSMVCLAGGLAIACAGLIFWAAAPSAGAVNPLCDWPDATVTFSGTYTDTDQNPTDAGGPFAEGDASFMLHLDWTSTVTGPMAGDQSDCFPPDRATLTLNGSFSYTPSPDAAANYDSTACSASFSVTPGVSEFDYAIGFATSPTGVPKGDYEPAEVEGFPPSDAASLGGVTSSDPGCTGPVDQGIQVGPSFDPAYNSTVCSEQPPADFSGPNGGFEVPCIAFGYDLKDGQTLGATSHNWTISYDGTDQSGGTETTTGSETLSVSPSCSTGSVARARADDGQVSGDPTETDVIYYSSRGSSEGKGLGEPGQALWNRLQAGPNVRLMKEANPYPAADIDKGVIKDIILKRRLGTTYDNSVAEGVKDGVEYLGSLAREEGGCQPWYVVMTGYSQGADVTRRIIADRALPGGVRDHIAAVELFGDPFFKRPAPATETPWGNYNGPAEGVGYINKHATPPALLLPTDSWCNENDMVCALYPVFYRELYRDLVRLGADTAKSDTKAVTADLLAFEHLRDTAVAGHYTYGTDACQAAGFVSKTLSADHVVVNSTC